MYFIFSIVHAACGSACFGEGEGPVHYRDVNCLSAQLFNNCSRILAGQKSCSSHFRDICGIQITKATLDGRGFNTEVR